jgi:small nuclear ribonucleoprotein (snRNP)-like protein
MTLENFLDKYVVIEKKDGKKVEGILTNILNSEESDENMGFITLVIREDNDKYNNVHLIEVENIGVLE